MANKTVRLPLSHITPRYIVALNPEGPNQGQQVWFKIGRDLATVATEADGFKVVRAIVTPEEASSLGLAAA